MIDDYLTHCPPRNLNSESLRLTQLSQKSRGTQGDAAVLSELP